WPPSQNALWRAFRNRTILSREGRAWYKYTAEALVGAPKVEGPVHIEVELAPPTKRRYDPDNRIKGLFDALVKSKVIEDDDNRIIKWYAVSTDTEGFIGVRVTIRPL
ncbi:MAG TPA: RusA family crossover junction endodeoxyribonuclease, partial [Candidatus Paceibacterota bacterium]